MQFIDRVSSSSWTKVLTCLLLCTFRVMVQTLRPWRSHSCSSRTRFFEVPVVVHVRGQDVQKSLELTQMQFCVAVDVPVTMQRVWRC